MKKLKGYEYYRNELGVIYCGKNEIVTPLIKEKIDLLYADPPYNFNAGGGKGFYNRPSKQTIIQKLKNTFGHKFDPKDFFNLVDSINNFKPYNIYVWTNSNLILDYLNWARKNKMTYAIIPWHKLNAPPLKNNNYLPDTEYLLFFRKKRAYFDSSLETAKYRKYYLTSVNTNNVNKYDHPTPKPLEITFSPIEISCPPAGIVLDPYCGTGTTLVTAIRTGRHYIGIDDTEKYCKISKERVQDELRQFKMGVR